jgi:hypothetical protein
VQEKKFVLHGDLRRLVLCQVELWKLLPSCSCINPLCHRRKLYHLDLLPVAHGRAGAESSGQVAGAPFPSIGSGAHITHNHNTQHQCLRLNSSLVLFVANEGDDKKTVSFNIWNGNGNEDDEWRRM